MKNQLKIFGITVVLLLCLCVSSIYATNCKDTWVSPDPNQIYSGARYWEHSIPASCAASCAKITVTLLVNNYNDVGTLDLYASNVNDANQGFDYGNPLLSGKKMGWIGRISVPLSGGWKTVSFPLRLPHFEWLNDNGSIYIALLGPEYYQGSSRAQFKVASATIETIPWNTDIDGDGDIDGSDLAELAANFGCAGGCAADFDGNDVVDENDLIAFGAEFSWSGCPLGFYESFNDGSANNWIRTTAWSVTDNTFQMNGSQPPQDSWQYGYYNKIFDDFSFEASVQQVEGDQNYAAGIYFRSSAALSNRYGFLIAAVGQYTIVKSVSGVVTQLVPWTNGNFYRGYNQWTRLGVTCTGSTLQFFIDQSLVKTVTDSSLTSGYVGLMAVDTDTDINIFQFEDVLLEEK